MIKERGKMTLTINTTIYGQLLAEFQPQVITNEAENERAIPTVSCANALAETLANKNNLTFEEDKLLELLITLIEKFEGDNYHLGSLSTPLSRLLFLIEENKLSESDLIQIFETEKILYDVLNNHIEISQELAVKLGERFKVASVIFTTNLINT